MVNSSSFPHSARLCEHRRNVLGQRGQRKGGKRHPSDAKCSLAGRFLPVAFPPKALYWQAHHSISGKRKYSDFHKRCVRQTSEQPAAGSWWDLDPIWGHLVPIFQQVHRDLCSKHRLFNWNQGVWSPRSTRASHWWDIRESSQASTKVTFTWVHQIPYEVPKDDVHLRLTRIRKEESSSKLQKLSQADQACRPRVRRPEISQVRWWSIEDQVNLDMANVKFKFEVKFLQRFRRLLSWGYFLEIVHPKTKWQRVPDRH